MVEVVVTAKDKERDSQSGQSRALNHTREELQMYDGARSGASSQTHRRLLRPEFSGMWCVCGVCSGMSSQGGVCSGVSSVCVCV